MQQELRDLWSILRTNDDVRCIVLTGRGDKAFCTGLDRGEIQSIDELPPGKLPGYNTPWDFDDPGKSVCPKSNDLWKPVIAAVNGMACGGAFYILGEVDFIIAADHATFFDPHVTYGMPAAFEPINLLHKMPFQEVVRLSLLGAHERMSAGAGPPDRSASPRSSPWQSCTTARRGRRTPSPSSLPWPSAAPCGPSGPGWSCRRRQALDHAFLFTNIGTNAASLAEGQERFIFYRPGSAAHLGGCDELIRAPRLLIFRSMIASMSRPSSWRTSSVCSPWSGARRELGRRLVELHRGRHHPERRAAAELDLADVAVGERPAGPRAARPAVCTGAHTPSTCEQDRLPLLEGLGGEDLVEDRDALPRFSSARGRVDEARIVGQLGMADLGDELRPVPVRLQHHQRQEAAVARSGRC